MECDELKRRRKLLAQALRRGTPDYFCVNDIDSQVSTPSRQLYVPQHITGDWYYAEDSLGNPVTIHFINKCICCTDCNRRNFEGIEVPPENHCHGQVIEITIDSNTTDMCFGILDRYSFLALDISEIKKKFLQATKQEDYLRMDNNVNNDSVAARRRALAEALRAGEPVVVTATGEVEKKEDAEDHGMSGIQVPNGKLA